MVKCQVQNWNLRIQKYRYTKTIVRICWAKKVLKCQVQYWNLRVEFKSNNILGLWEQKWCWSAIYYTGIWEFRSNDILRLYLDKMGTEMVLKCQEQYCNLRVQKYRYYKAAVVRLNGCNKRCLRSYNSIHCIVFFYFKEISYNVTKLI